MVVCGASEFVLFGRAHGVAIGATLALPAALILLARRVRSERWTRAIRWSLAALLVGSELVAEGYKIATSGWGHYLRGGLPLHFCGIALFATAWTLIRPNRWTFEVAYFWGLAGTLPAVLTPEMHVGFPHFHFIQYFITHGLIVTGVLFAVFAMRLRPAGRAVLRIFLLTNAFALLVGGVDWILGANYMFLREPPDTAAPLFFLSWPWYILLFEPLSLILFTALYLPVRRPSCCHSERSEES